MQCFRSVSMHSQTMHRDHSKTFDVYIVYIVGREHPPSHPPPITPEAKEILILSIR